MGSPVLELENVTVWRGDNKVFDGLSLRIETGEKIAVLGPNGAGKSTLLALISGDIHPVADQGSSRLFGEDYWSLYDLREHIGVVTPEQHGLFADDELASDVVLTGLHGTYGITRGQTFTAAEKRRAWRAMLELAADDEDICILGSLRGNAGVPRPFQAPSRRSGDMQKSVRECGEIIEKIEMFHR